MSSFTEAVHNGLKGLNAVSSGSCPDCPGCEEDDSVDEPSFSSQPCGVCNSHLAGDRHVWHALSNVDESLYHFSDMCTDCVMYLANGDEPEVA